jgi:membrane protein
VPEPVEIVPWWQRVDRDRVRAFFGFLWKRFLENSCFQTAGSLSYTTLLAVVPVTATVLGVIAMFPIYQRWGDALTVFLFRHFVPKAASDVSSYIRAFASSARGLTGLGAVGVLTTSLLTMWGIEDAFNRIWCVVTPRHWVARFMIYVVALTIGPLVAVGLLAIWSSLFSLPLMAAAKGTVSLRFWLGLTSITLEGVGFTAAYWIIPNRTVRLRHALVGGVLATVLFEAAKNAIAYYLTRASYQQIYGAVAIAPIFLLWIWVSWLVVLLGATLSAALSTFSYQPASLRLPKGFEFYALLRLLGRFSRARRGGQGLHTADMHALEPILTDELLQRMLGAAAQIDLVHRDERGAWFLSRDLHEVGLVELYEAVALPIPVGEAVLPCSDDALGASAQAALDELRLPLRERLQRSVGSIYPPEFDEHPKEPAA